MLTEISTIDPIKSCCTPNHHITSLQLLDWHLQLDRCLPAPLDMVGAWLHEAEGALRQEIIVQQPHDVTANTVHRALEQHKVSTESGSAEIKENNTLERCWLDREQPRPSENTSQM